MGGNSLGVARGQEAGHPLRPVALASVADRDGRELSWLLANRRYRCGAHSHVVDRMLALLAAHGIEPAADMRLYTGPDDAAWWAARRRSQRYAVLAPTARWVTKRWPAERWAALAGTLRQRGFEQICVIGAPHELDQVAAVQEAGADVDVLLEELTIGRTMAVIEHAAIVVANDSAPLHMAVGLDRPLVGLFGPTNPARVGPYKRESAVVRPPADVRASLTGGSSDVNYRDRALGDRIMRAITLDQVVERVEAVVETARDLSGAE